MGMQIVGATPLLSHRLATFSRPCNEPPARIMCACRNTFILFSCEEIYSDTSNGSNNNSRISSGGQTEMDWCPNSSCLSYMCMCVP